MKLAYYPGCSAKSTCRELNEAMHVVAASLELDLMELESATCTGARELRAIDPIGFHSLNVRILALAEREHLPLMTICNTCTLNLLDANENFPTLPSGCTIRRGRPEEARELGAIVENAFFPEGPPEPFRDLLTPLYRMPGAITFAAPIEGKTVACGAGLTIPEHRVFAICGAGTAAEFRNRGLQTALLQARLAAAAKAGCEYAVVVTQGGTTSQRNYERQGFRVAYSKITLIKNLP